VLFLLIRIPRRPPILFRRHCCCNCNVDPFRLDGFQFQVLLLYQRLLFRWLLWVLQLLLMAPPHYHRSIPPELPTRIHGYCYWCNTASRWRRCVCSNPREVQWETRLWCCVWSFDGVFAVDAEVLLFIAI
jgi:hypothetical protein